ncbi:MAG TPA: hypothetical protein VE573_00540 [Nitrososphaeraceae archaeon]|nr:hypothetical protein [Thermoproteota archaeon]MDQ3983838.1 hypothetical protein [Thermoproteota archaeon]HZA61329.1 hypothetical protein [Nitrososphaeraceae archaeon]
MTSANNFALEQGKSAKAIDWMNSYAKMKNRKLEIRSENYSLSTLKFGNFEAISWNGDWSAARLIIVKASSKLNMKVIEAGYHKKGSLLSSLLGGSDEIAKVYSGGKLVGNIVLKSKSGKWIVKSEKTI